MQEAVWLAPLLREAKTVTVPGQQAIPGFKVARVDILTHIRKPDAFLNKCIIYVIHAQKLNLNTHYSSKSSCHQQGKPREKNNLLLNLKTLYMHQEEKKAI